MKQLLPQKCPTAFLYLTWVLYAAVTAYLALRGDYVRAVVWLVAFPPALWAYVRLFPRISEYMGYGRVDDDAAAETPATGGARVTMYSSLGCPFCPIVERRLKELQGRMGFELDVVDVTVRPDVARSKGIKSVPVVEAGGHRLIGHATTRQLAELVRGPRGGDREVV